MKKIIAVLVVLLVFYCIGKVSESLSDEMYSDCLRAGKHSEDTCYKYAYLQ